MPAEEAMNKTTKKRMFSAIQDRDLPTLYAILDNNPDAMETVGEHNSNVRDKTPLMFAMQCANLSLANALLDRGAKPSAVMAGGPCISVLALCVKFAYCDPRQHDDWIRLATRLLDKGADPTSALWPALHGFGRIVNRADLISLLLDRGANPDQLVGNTGDTARELVEVNRHLYSDEVLKLFHLNNTESLPNQ
jgi:ankyrin repeat protein